MIFTLDERNLPDLTALLDYLMDDKESDDFDENAVPEYDSRAEALAKSSHVYAIAHRLNEELKKQQTAQKRRRYMGVAIGRIEHSNMYCARVNNVGLQADTLEGIKDLIKEHKV